jgi:hypothetical protein
MLLTLCPYCRIVGVLGIPSTVLHASETLVFHVQKRRLWMRGEDWWCCMLILSEYFCRGEAEEADGMRVGLRLLFSTWLFRRLNS